MSKYSLVGVDGNAFMIMGYTARALKNEGLGHLVDEMHKKATAGDYYNLIAICDEYLYMANTKAKESGYEDEEDDE